MVTRATRLIDLKTVFTDWPAFRDNALLRGYPSDKMDSIRSMGEEYKIKDFELSKIKAERNKLQPHSVPEHISKAQELKSLVKQRQNELDELKKRLDPLLRHLPNQTHPDTPRQDPLEMKRFGKPPIFDFQPKTHIELCQLHELADFERGSRVTGKGFYYLKGKGALLELALVRFALDQCMKAGFTPVITPDVIQTSVLADCGFAPRSDDPQTYFLHKNVPEESTMGHCLTATAEFPLAAMHADECLSKLPIKYAGHSHCFRAEGLDGARNRGLYRVHQFTKVELFAFCDPEESHQMLQEFVKLETDIFNELELNFKVLNMPLNDMGAPAYQKFDIEAWMPGRNDWGEISSASNCIDYQAKRLNIKRQRDNRHVHTVNGTAIAVTRMMVALLETHQNASGDVYIPVALRPYFLGPKVDMIKR
jgi:seryl-tRNA synthetase